MNHHEREFFICLIRSGKLIINDKNIKLEIRPLTIEQSLEACLIYQDAYNSAFVDGIMTEYEVHKWMDENGLWTFEHEEKTKGFKKDLDKLRIEIYNNRNETKLRESIRRYIRLGEKQFSEHLKEKNSYFQNTREGYALSEKISWIIKNSTYIDNKLYDFKDISLSYVIDEYQNSILSETNIRELAREEPWKSLWSIKENINNSLFSNPPNTEYTVNQKNLIIWSQVYDNIQESIDCPNEDVIKDDDLLDGWLLIQAKKRETERAEKDFESLTKNDKIKNSSEVFVVTQDKTNAKRIDSLNNPIAQAIKKQRYEVIKEKGTIHQHELPDEKLNIQMQLNNLQPHKPGGYRG